MDRLFRAYDRVSSGGRLPSMSGEFPGMSTAVADLQEIEERLIATLKLPGTRKEDISLAVTEALEVQGWVIA